MRTYTTNLMTENGLTFGAGVGRNYRLTGNTVRTVVRKAKLGKRAKNVALFFAAPFIGLVYLLSFPLVGFALLAGMAVKAILNHATARPIALALAAPFIGLAFVTVGPIVGLGALAWMGARAWLRY